MISLIACGIFHNALVPLMASTSLSRPQLIVAQPTLTTKGPGSHSVVLMAVCDALYRFILDIGDVGRHSDGGVLGNSGFGQALKNGTIALPQECPLAGTVYTTICHCWQRGISLIEESTAALCWEKFARIPQYF